MAERITRGEMLLQMANAVRRRSTCSRAQVGALIIQGGRPVMTGYNGAPAGMPHCDHTCTCDEDYPDADYQPTLHQPTCPARPGCATAVHAEANAIAYAAREGIRVQGSRMFVTLSPCYPCALLIASAGVSELTYLERYRDTSGLALLVDAGVAIHSFSEAAKVYDV
jgi:dCMP deaminase